MILWNIKKMNEKRKSKRRIEWEGKPLTTKYLRKSERFLLPFTIFGSVICIIAAYSLLKHGLNIHFTAIIAGIVLSITAIAIVPLRLLWDFHNRKLKHYQIRDGMILIKHRNRIQHEINIKTINGLIITDQRNDNGINCGTIILNRNQPLIIPINFLSIAFPTSLNILKLDFINDYKQVVNILKKHNEKLSITEIK